MVKVNGKVISGAFNCSSIVMNGNDIIIDGKKVNLDEVAGDEKNITIVIADCTIESLDCQSCEVHGSKIHDLDCNSCKIEGDVVGDVDGQNVTVGGDVGGDIDCNIATIHGNVSGKVKANIVNN